jgi:hypothetical protein
VQQLSRLFSIFILIPQKLLCDGLRVIQPLVLLLLGVVSLMMFFLILAGVLRRVFSRLF